MFRKIADFLFIATGTEFYMDWVLPTNPSSHNPFIRIFLIFLKPAYNFHQYRIRLGVAIAAFSMHSFFCILMLINPQTLFSLVSNLFVNIYPMMIQLYIGYRCICVIKEKKVIAMKRMKKEGVVFFTPKSFFKSKV